MGRGPCAVALGVLVAGCTSLDGLTGGAHDSGARPSPLGDPIADGGAADGVAEGSTVDGSGGGELDATDARDPFENLDSSLDGAGAIYADLILSDRPLGYWRFEETSGTVAHDSSGHGHDGTYGADVVLGQGGLIGGGLAARFDGSDDTNAAHFVRIPETTGLEPITAITVECWVLMSDAGEGVNLISYGSDSVTPYEPYVLFFDKGAPQAYVVAGDGGIEIGGQSAITTTTSHHLVMVYDGGSLILYVDGASVASAATTGVIAGYDALNGLGIGSGFSATRANFGGILDEVAVYGVALAPTRVAQHYEAGRFF